MNQFNLSGDGFQNLNAAVETPENLEARAARALAEELDGHYVRLYSKGANSSEASHDVLLNATFENEFEKLKSGGALSTPSRARRAAIDFQRTFLVATTAFLAIGFCTFSSSGNWPAFSKTEVSQTKATGDVQKNAPPDTRWPEAAVAVTDKNETAASGESQDQRIAANDTATAANPAASASTPADDTASTPLARVASRGEDDSVRSGADGLRSDNDTTLISNGAPSLQSSTPDAAETPSISGADSFSAREVQQNQDAAPATNSPVVRSSAQSNPQFGSSAGRPMKPGSGGGYVSLRRGDNNSDFEAARLTRAIEGSGGNNRDLAELYQQRALLYLNQGDNERAKPDFQQAIELYSAMIQRGDHVREAQDGLQAARNGLNISNKTQVF